MWQNFKKNDYFHNKLAKKNTTNKCDKNRALFPAMNSTTDI